MVSINRRTVYLLCKQMADDPKQSEFRTTVEGHRATGLGWRYDGLKDWTTEAIFAKLRELGVDTDADRFRAQAREAGRCAALEDRWLAGTSLAERDFWCDFALIASEELWERLAPDLPCPELLSTRLEAAVAADRNPRSTPGATPGAVPDEVPPDLGSVLALADYLSGFSPADRKGRFRDVCECGLSDYGAWALDMVLRHGREYPDEVTRLADVLSDCMDAKLLQADLAMALAMAGRRDEAVRRARRNVEAFPNDPWARILAGDVYDELGDGEGALGLWVEALPMTADPLDWEAAADRIQELLERTGRSGEWDDIQRRHPPPEPPRRDVRTAPAPPDRAAGLFRAPPARTAPPVRNKVGRNDPCPCGSRKKYKKCCLRGG